MSLWLDRIFIAAIVFLILATPFAFGTVHPWAYATMEVVIFALVIVWMAKRAILAREQGAWSTEQGAVISSGSLLHARGSMLPLALPLALFIVLCAMQLVPLPPSFLQVISPQTFETYRQILPGWPDAVPYAELPSMEQRAGSEVGGQRSEGGIEPGAGNRESATEQKSEVRDRRSDVGQAQSAKSEEQRAKGGEQRSEVGGQKSEVEDSDMKSAISAMQAPIQNLESKIQNSSGSMLHALSSLLPAPSSLLPPTWLPLSVSPTLSKIDLLKFAAFAALFLLVWRYPFAEPFDNFEFQSSNSKFFVLSPEQRFLRTAIFAVLVTGLLVAAVGFIERFSWNGKILWFFVPHDWGEAMPNGIPRASGPFVNPDHFANYLSLIFPLALGCALFRTFMVSQDQQSGCQIFCGFTAFLLFTGILLSLSRGGWISALLGVVILAWLAPWQRQRAKSREQGAGSRSSHASRLTPHASRSHEFARVARLSFITVCLLLIVSLFFVGSGGREQVDARLEETFYRDVGMAGRVAVWQDTLGMIRDFPILGVGLGAWPELFTRYEQGPWSSDVFVEAHNDYVELLAETGVVGFGLLAAFFVAAGKRLVHSIDKVSSKNVPLLAGILAASGGMALHSWLDFSLQIPANAFLFTVLLALGLRIGKSKEQGARSREQEVWRSEGMWQSPVISMEPGAWSAKPGGQRPAVGNQMAEKLFRISNFGFRNFAICHSPFAISFAALALIVCAVMQSDAEVKPVQSIAESKDRLLSRPTKASYHLSLVRRVGDQAPLDWQLSEYRAALWIQPTNPYIRDKYAATLIAMGKTAEGLKEIARSVTDSPSLDAHDYLDAESLPDLSVEVRHAVEAGFKQALARSYPESLTGLSEFYAKLDRFTDQAALYEQAASKEMDGAKKVDLLMKGGLAYLKAAEKQGAGSKELSAKNQEQGAGSKEQGAKGKEQSAKGERQGAKSEGQRAESREHGAASTELDATNNPKAAPQTKIQNPESVPNTELQAPSSALHASALRLFRAAAAINPADPKPYQQLIGVAFAAETDSAEPRKLIDKAIENGAPALPLYLSLAEAAHKGGNPDESRAALKLAKAQVDRLIKNGENPATLYMLLADGARAAGDRETETAAVAAALERHPRSPEILMRLAGLYLAKQNYSRASLYLNRIASINPSSADVYYQIAQAEEGQYRFAAADQAYARAVQLAPQNAGYRERYEAFRQRVAANAPERDPQRAKGEGVRARQ